MNEATLIKHEIYTKLTKLSRQELNSVADFIDFVHKKNKQPPVKKKIIKLQGVLAGYDLTMSDLKKFKSESWKHLEQEF